MTELAIIGGTGLARLQHLDIERREVMHTPYGEPSGALTFGKLHGKAIAFLPRHGYGHRVGDPLTGQFPRDDRRYDSGLPHDDAGLDTAVKRGNRFGDRHRWDPRTRLDHRS